jgi:hypothetical protein
LALTSAAFVMTGVMLLANLLITPYFMQTNIETVRGMIPTLLLPFNVLKALINVGVVLLLYKTLSRALRRAKVLPRSSVAEGTAEKPVAHRRLSLIVFAAALLLILGSAIVIFTVLGGRFDFGI